MIFDRILLNRLNNHLEQGLLPESQCGFRRHRGTKEMIFATRQLQEKCQKMRTHLYSTFVDLTKAFDTVNREGLWKIMQKFGCPERFTQMVRQLHDAALERPPAAKAKREAPNSHLRPVRNADVQPLSTCPQFQRKLRARIGLVGHLRINCTSGTAPTAIPPPASSPSYLPPTTSGNSSEPPLPSSSSTTTSCTSSSCSSTIVPTIAAQAGVSHITNPDTTTDTTPTSSDSSDEDQDYTCSHCDRTFTSHIGPISHLRIHRTETGESVPGAPNYTHSTRLHCRLYPRTFTHRMGLFGHMRIHESGIDRSNDSSIMLTPTPTSSPCAPPPSFPQLTPTPPTSPAHTVHAHSTLASAWLVACESIAQRLENQCLGHQPIPTKLESTAHTALTPSGIASTHSRTSSTTTTHQHSPTASTQLPPPTQVGSPDLDSVHMQLRLQG
nr:unnamed protein product [Spirometra erinaceieuropaei]